MYPVWCHRPQHEPGRGTEEIVRSSRGHQDVGIGAIICAMCYRSIGKHRIVEHDGDRLRSIQYDVRVIEFNLPS